MWSYDPNIDIVMPEDVTDSMLNRYSTTCPWVLRFLEENVGELSCK
jgi:hypothetical protein